MPLRSSFWRRTVTADFIVYHKGLVRPEEVRSHWDLFNPKWKGKIVAYDPRLPGGASSQMRFLYYNPKLGPKFISQLLPGRRLVNEALQRAAKK